ncbi:MAG: hypothetical protein J2P19_00620 [Pseudonocardia sp.]|nr:hypothetical protein [Pseudonocardia sp.]
MAVLAAHIARITAQRYPARVIPVGLAETITRMGAVAHRLVEAARVEAAATALDHHAAHHARDDAAQLAAGLAHVQTVLGERHDALTRTRAGRIARRLGQEASIVALTWPRRRPTPGGLCIVPPVAGLQSGRSKM